MGFTSVYAQFGVVAEQFVMVYGWNVCYRPALLPQACLITEATELEFRPVLRSCFRVMPHLSQPAQWSSLVDCRTGYNVGPMYNL